MRSSSRADTHRVLPRLLRTPSSADPTGGLARLGLAPGNARLFDALVEHAPVGVFLTDAAGACLYANLRLCELTGVPFEQQLGYGWREALHPEDVARVAAAWEAAAEAGARLSHNQRFVRPDGSVTWVDMTAVPIRGAGGCATGWAGVCVDVTERRLSENRYRDLVEHARDAIYAADPAGNLVSVNQAGVDMSGYSREELLGMNFLDLIAPEDAEVAMESMGRSLSGEDQDRIELRLIAKDGHQVYVDVTGRLVEEDGRPVRFEGIARDMTEQHALQEQLAHQAFHDPLTGLPNRALLLDRLGHALSAAGRAGTTVAAILLDLDDFKLVNDGLGHEAGDHLLGSIAPRLLKAVRDGDTVARLGGDEFALVIEALEDEREVVTIAERIVFELNAPFTVGAATQRVTASLGVALAHPGDDPSTVLRNADTAMYSAKANNRGGFELFDDDMRAHVLRELGIKNALVEALHNEQLQVYYQPIVSLDDGRVLAAEALVRWCHPEWGWVQPNEFIPIAEASGLVLPLGEFVFAEAARQAAYWQARHPDVLPLGVFVNVSPRQLATADFAAFVRSTITDLGLDPTRLGLELTERAFADDRDEQTVTNLAALNAMGIRLSLDDFGTGYSALASLKRFPFTAIKIDRYFIRAIRTPTDPAPISSAIVGLGRALGLTVVAEGVETDVQAHYLRRLGCHAAQGYLYARPQPADALTTYLMKDDLIPAQAAV
jgi:diguanylate cyclase (GGDEF)-like protein/PAS domain S-box-containing protein